MRIIMMGTGRFAVPTFRSLLDSFNDVCMLITRPPHPGHRQRKLPLNPMRQVAEEIGLPFETPESINAPEALALLEQQAADLFVVCDYGQILSAEALGQAKLGGINLHASLLPLYRGAAPINWALYDGKSETGITVIHMTRRLDAGPTLVQQTVAIGPRENAVQLEERLATLGVASIQKAITLLADWDGKAEIGEKQDSHASTKAPRLSREDGLVDWNRSAIQIANQVRAFKPWPGTFSHCLRAEGEPLRVILDEAIAAAEPHDPQLDPGVVANIEGRFLVATGDGLLQIDSIQPAGRNRQPWDAFLRGYRVVAGDRFGGTVRPPV